jgi:hypothetical protein
MLSPCFTTDFLLCNAFGLSSAGHNSSSSSQSSFPRFTLARLPFPPRPLLFSSPLELSSELLVSDSLLLLEEELLSLLLLSTSSGSLLVTLLCTARLFFFLSVVFPPLASLLLFSLLAFPLLAFFFILCSPVT